MAQTWDLTLLLTSAQTWDLLLLDAYAATAAGNTTSTGVADATAYNYTFYGITGYTTVYTMRDTSAPLDLNLVTTTGPFDTNLVDTTGLLDTNLVTTSGELVLVPVTTGDLDPTTDIPG